jgi:hypothetical protein
MGPSDARSTLAAWLLGASATIRETYGMPRRTGYGDEEALLDQGVAATRARLSDQVYDAAYAEGQALSHDRAVELALALAMEIQATDA